MLNAIIGQQLSVSSASAISRKFLGHFGKKPKPEDIINTSDVMLKSLGLSNAKTKYVKDLSIHIQNGNIKFRGIKNKNNEEIISELTAVKGIGLWTAHMFLIFTLARLDVLPYGDLGIKKAIMLNYGFKNLPNEQDIVELAKKKNWHPYESVASWYLWESIDN